jgi:hypothetical protein
MILTSKWRTVIYFIQSLQETPSFVTCDQATIFWAYRLMTDPYYCPKFWLSLQFSLLSDNDQRIHSPVLVSVLFVPRCCKLFAMQFILKQFKSALEPVIPLKYFELGQCLFATHHLQHFHCQYSLLKHDVSPVVKMINFPTSEPSIYCAGT